MPKLLLFVVRLAISSALSRHANTVGSSGADIWKSAEGGSVNGRLRFFFS